jgi:hypothetical protein
MRLPLACLALSAVFSLAGCGPSNPVDVGCHASNCAGCCTEDGTCVTESNQSKQACGAAGESCQVCPGSLQCVSRQCAGAGTGGGTGGGGGSTGGGTGGGTPVDAGHDAGTVDAGHDAGAPDAGFDAGPDDAGSQTCDDPFDAGTGPFTFDPADAGKPDGSVFIQAIQDPGSTSRPDAGTTVTIFGVVATTPRALISGFDGGTCTYGAWVEEPAGGPSSGLLLTSFVFATDGGLATGPGCPDGGPIPGDLVVGEAVSARGKYIEFCGGSPCENVAELRVSSLTRLGTAPVPPPVVVDATEIGEGVSQQTLDRSLEGTLVQLRWATVTDTNPDAPNYYRDWVVGPADGGTSNTTWVHNTFDYAYRPVLGHTFKCVTGPLWYSFGHYKVEPRTDLDLVRQVH